MTGQALRLIDVSADAGAGLGVWSDLHGQPNGASLSHAVKLATSAHHGHAGPAFVAELVRDLPGATARAESLVERFLNAARAAGDHGQIERAGRRFALVAAAGELATAWGVLPWREGEALDAALATFTAWAEAFGRSAPREHNDVLRTLKAALEQHGSRFASLVDDLDPDRVAYSQTEARALQTLGFRHVSGAETFFLFHDAGWAETFKGFDPAYAAKVVAEAGFLERGDGGRLKRKHRVNGQPRRFYWVRAELLAADDDA